MSHGGHPRRAPTVRRTVPWVVLVLVLCGPVVSVLVLCGPVVSVLALPGVGRASKAAGRSDTAAVAARRRQRLAELDVSAAAVKLLAGNVLAGSATVGNVGSARARSSTAAVAWRASTGGGLVQLGRFKVPALKPGQRHKAKFQFDLPKGASGSYEVSVCADVLGQVQERSKKNDCRDAGVITVPGSGVKASGPTSSEPSSPSGSPPGGSSPAPGSPTPTPPASSPPSIVIDSGPSGVLGVSSVTFTFHGSDTNDTFQCSLDGAPWASCASPQQYSSLAEGAHTFQVRAINAAGEVDPTPASASFTVEATPPQTTITSAPSGRIPTGEVSISFTSTEAGSSFQCSLDGAAYSPCSSPDVIKDPEAGPHTFKVQATNQARVKETAAPPSASWSSVEPQHDLCGTIVSNTMIGPDYAALYIITCDVDVPAGVTLTAQPGATIKADSGTNLSVQGTLDSAGTASEPITFTSVNDNSVGAATGSGTPVAGEWDGIASTATGSVNVEHAHISYAGVGVQAEGGGPTVVRDDSFVASATSAAAIFGSPSPTLEGNSSNGASGPAAFVVQSPSLNAGLLGGNSATGAGIGVVDIAGSLGTSSTLSAEPAPWEVGNIHVPGLTPSAEPLEVPDGVTLTIAPGAVIKGDHYGSESATCGNNVWCSIWVEGALHAVGTEAEPIVFTSINDNAVGGTTGSGTPAAGDWWGMYSQGSGASIDLEHAKVSFAQTGVLAYGEGGAVVKNDAFVSQSSGAVVISGVPSPTLLDNSSVDSGGPAFGVRSGSLDAGLLGGNSATGGGSGVVAIAGTIGTSSTLPAEPAPWEVGSRTFLEPLKVPEGQTLTIAPGAVVKGDHYGSESATCGNNVWCSIWVEGALHAVGTEAEPIVFTSINDNAVGGTTGSGTPAAGDWNGIYSTGNSGSIDLEHAKVSYAGTGLALEGGTALLAEVAVSNSDLALEAQAGHASFRGELSNDSSGIHACDWGSQACSVDAAYTYWGTPDWAVSVGTSARLRGCYDEPLSDIRQRRHNQNRGVCLWLH